MDAQRLQRPCSTLIACPSGGDGAVEGVRFTLDGLGEAPRRFGLLGLDPLGERFEGDKALIERPHPTMRKPEAGVGHTVEKGPVVTDHQEGGAALENGGFERLNGENVEMVGGLVQQKKVWMLGERASERGAADLPARQPARGLVRIEFKGREPGARLPIHGAAGHTVIQQRVACNDRFLRHIDNPQARLEKTVAAVGDDLPRQDPHQGGFTRAVASHQRRAASRLERHIDAFEQLNRTIGQPNVTQGRDGWSSRRTRGRSGGSP